MLWDRRNQNRYMYYLPLQQKLNVYFVTFLVLGIYHHVKTDWPFLPSWCCCCTTTTTMAIPQKMCKVNRDRVEKRRKEPITALTSSSSRLEWNYTNNDHKVDNAPTLFPLFWPISLRLARSHVHWELAVVACSTSCRNKLVQFFSGLFPHT